MKDRPVTTLGQGLEVQLARLEAMAAESKKFGDAWRAWFASRDRSATCPDHEGTELEVDQDESLRRSYATQKNRVVFKACAKCLDAINRAAENELLEKAGVPKNMLHCTFENFEVTTEAHKAALATAKAMARKQTGALLLLGKDNGVGKTHLAVALLRSMKSGLFVTQNGLMDDVRRNRFHVGNVGFVDWIERASRKWCLVLDEVGLSTGAKDELPAVHSVIDDRYGASLPTVITSNCGSMDQLEPILGFRIMDRLRDYARGVHVLSGKSWRGKKAERAKSE